QHFVRLLQGHPGRQAGKLAHNAKKSDCGYIGDESLILGHIADTRFDFAGAGVTVESENARRSGRGLMKSQQREDQSGFTRPVRSKQADRLSAAGNTEPAGDALKDLAPAQFDSQVLEFDYRCHERAAYSFPLSP